MCPMAEDNGLIRRVNIRNTHPALWRVITAASLMKVALAVNFWTSNPTFNPWEIPKNNIGWVFFVLGVSQLFFINVIHSLPMVRIVLATSIFWLLFWGASNTQQAFDGRASFQLPILYLALAVSQMPLLIEPAVNPVTRRNE